MKIGVLKETRADERRVALVPESVERLIGKGVEVVVAKGAGAAAGFADAEYEAAGASAADSVLGTADLLVKVNPLSPEEVAAARSGAAAISLLYPLVNAELVALLRDRSLTSVALDRIPRITLAQSMDVLSSQSTVAGYRAAIVAIHQLPRFVPLLMTAAGRIDAARVLVLGAGVAGLQAIATARRLGALVEAYDVRAAVKEQVESLGATFVEVGETEDAETEGGYAKEVSEDAQRRAEQVLAQRLEETDACITTALIPGRPAPRLITAEMARRMRPGSVIVDMAAEQGGNCELTRPGEDVVDSGVTILGPTNLASELATDASRMFSRNLEKLITYLLKEGEIEFDFDNQIVSGSVVTHGGKIVDEQVAEAIQ